MGTASSRWSSEDTPRGAEYNRRFEALAAAGHDVHGEASFVMGYGPPSVLDAGCGTGRVAIELARRGVQVVGVDVDRAMLQTAVDSAPDIEFFLADLSTLSLRNEDGTRRRFHMVVAAGNVMIFLEGGTEAATVARLAAHLVPGGLLVAGFQLAPQGYRLDHYDVDCSNAGLELAERFSTWDRDPWTGSGGYAVSVHRRVPSASER